MIVCVAIGIGVAGFAVMAGRENFIGIAVDVAVSATVGVAACGIAFEGNGV